jgi:hypothetical protein
MPILDVLSDGALLSNVLHSINDEHFSIRGWWPYRQSSASQIVMYFILLLCHWHNLVSVSMKSFVYFHYFGISALLGYVSVSVHVISLWCVTLFLGLSASVCISCEYFF